MRVFLDAQQWNYMVEPPPGGVLGIPIDGLLAGVGSGDIVVVGSLELLQELVETGRRLPGKFSQMRQLFEQLTGSRVLRPLHERHLLEARQGGRAPEPSCYLTRSERREALAKVRRRQDVSKLADLAHEEKASYKTREEELRDTMTEHLEAIGEHPTLERMRDWLRTETDIDDWVAGIVAEGVADGHLAPVGDRPNDLAHWPTVWLYTAARLARLVYTLGGGRRIAGSDLADSVHASAAGYCDVLVTDDKAFQESLALLDGELPFRVSTSKAFCGELAL